ncbi:hypothetical protein BDV95DRAFT_593400 [Massariosphaeria phaeospora]|uniref:Uncharacterized protein n=1 Tax=Massariosphaeria phaeospora TaxID=100035 RepID=A0A7C8M9S7_9PLEO|nr:hypothetical protein BDV95DRAFT_593400 [Massariosphaeria phaeospora]
MCHFHSGALGSGATAASLGRRRIRPWMGARRIDGRARAAAARAMMGCSLCSLFLLRWCSAGGKCSSPARFAALQRCHVFARLHCTRAAASGPRPANAAPADTISITPSAGRSQAAFSLRRLPASLPACHREEQFARRLHPAAECAACAPATSFLTDSHALSRSRSASAPFPAAPRVSLPPTQPAANGAGNGCAVDPDVGRSLSSARAARVGLRQGSGAGKLTPVHHSLEGCRRPVRLQSPDAACPTAVTFDPRWQHPPPGLHTQAPSVVGGAIVYHRWHWRLGAANRRIVHMEAGVVARTYRKRRRTDCTLVLLVPVRRKRETSGSSSRYSVHAQQKSAAVDQIISYMRALQRSSCLHEAVLPRWEPCQDMYFACQVSKPASAQQFPTTWMHDFCFSMLDLCDHPSSEHCLWDSTAGGGSRSRIISISLCPATPLRHS